MRQTRMGQQNRKVNSQLLSVFWVRWGSANWCRMDDNKEQWVCSTSNRVQPEKNLGCTFFPKLWKLDRGTQRFPFYIILENWISVNFQTISICLRLQFVTQSVEANKDKWRDRQQEMYTVHFLLSVCSVIVQSCPSMLFCNLTPYDDYIHYTMFYALYALYTLYIVLLTKQ